MREVANHFPLLGAFLDAQRYCSGHINDTFAANFDQAGVRVRYIFQRICHNIFKNVPELMENISRVTLHLAGKAAGGDSRRALTLLPARDGAPFYKTPEGDFWRVYLFVEGARMGLELKKECLPDACAHPGSKPPRQSRLTNI